MRQAAIAANGGSFSPTLLSVSQSDAAPSCAKKFGHWCLDGKHINRGGIIAIIVIGSLIVLGLLAAIPALVIWRAHKARNYDTVWIPLEPDSAAAASRSACAPPTTTNSDTAISHGCCNLQTVGQTPDCQDRHHNPNLPTASS